MLINEKSEKLDANSSSSGLILLRFSIFLPELLEALQPLHSTELI